MKPFALSLVFAALACPLAAQEVRPCDWPARADALVEPWEQHTATFANGDVRLALLDTIEPAAGAFHILILSPPYDELGARQCATLGLGEQMGFAGVEFSSLTSGYDPAIGLIFAVRVKRFDGADYLPAMLHFSLNQATGAIHAELR